MCVFLYDDVLFSGKCIYFKNRLYVTFCCLHGKTIRTKCNLRVAFSVNSWIYNKKVIIQLYFHLLHSYLLHILLNVIFTTNISLIYNWTNAISPHYYIITVISVSTELFTWLYHMDKAMSCHLNLHVNYIN